MSLPFRVGLKLWSTNINLVPEVVRLYGLGIIQYLELYVVPGTFQDYGDQWQSLVLPKVLHAPHFGSGFNLSLSECVATNQGMWFEVLQFANRLSPEGLVVHLGTQGQLRESMRQLRLLNTPPCPIWIENKPYVGLHETTCVGVTATDIQEIQSVCGTGFCFDLAHAMCLAAYEKRDYGSLFEEFFALKPDIYHLSDGLVGEVRDLHLHLQEGDYDLDTIVGLLPDNALVSLETPKKSLQNLRYFETECGILERMRSN